MNKINKQFRGMLCQNEPQIVHIIFLVIVKQYIKELYYFCTLFSQLRNQQEIFVTLDPLEASQTPHQVPEPRFGYCYACVLLSVLHALFAGS